MPKKPKKTDFAPQGHAFSCAAGGCGEPGEYKAPKTREALEDYIWLCLEHVREHNKSWDYFEGMDMADIEAFQKDAVTGHRPTWDRESRLRAHYFTLQDKLYEFLHGTAPTPAKPRIPAKTRKALAVMEIDYPYTLDSLKTRYRALVKKHHPDANKGDKKSEDAFKNITAAYRYLMEQLKT